CCPMADMIPKILHKRAAPQGGMAMVATEGVGALGEPTTSGESDDPLIALFKNRAELKKAFSELRAENDELRERLERAGADPSQNQQRLAALEQRLSERETAYPALVYFQLRGLWRFCHNQLVEFSEQLQEQHQAREAHAHDAAHEQEKAAAISAIDDRIKLVTAEHARAAQGLKDQGVRLEQLGALWHYFRRRALREDMDRQEQIVAEVRGRLEALRERRRAEAEKAAPAFSGLPIESRRIINLAVIAFAQYLYVEFAPNSLSTLSHAAINCTVNEVSYGTQRDCEALMEIIERALAMMVSKRGYGDELKLRARHLKLKATFDGETATVPTLDAVNTFPIEFHQGQAGVKVDVNILADDYWYLNEVLLP
ncbi:MAG: hypothetical protein AAFX85_05205, partial [Pseudomonadota bacterium]